MSRPGRYLHLARIYGNYAVARRVRFAAPPLRLWIELTNTCNLACTMCPTSLPDAPPKGLMSFELFTRIVDEAAGFAYDTALHHRGESTLHPRLPEMIAYAARAGMRTKLHTNGSRLGTELAEAIIRSGLDYLSFSFDGYTKETYERVRRKASFDTTVGNIREFLRVKKALGSRTPHTVIEVIDFPGAGIGDLGARGRFLSLFEGLPLDEHRIKSPHNWAGSCGDAREAGRIVPCTFPWFALVVFWDGTVVPCPQDFYGKLALGSAADQTLMDIWRGEPLRRLREAMRARDLSGYPVCAACDNLRRPTLLGVPTPNMKRFLTETVLGYRRHGGESPRITVDT